ncbi:MAG: amidohydrolase family protein [Chloroflexi bacterium]|nr:amidohydrolase family protein [Chloroflexota bacterium]
MIIDFHTHIFPPQVRDERDEYIRRDATFAEMYADPKTKLATSEDLLEQMDAAEVGASVAVGFAWTDDELNVRHNDYLLDEAAKSDGRIVPFCTVNPAHDSAAEEAIRVARAGAKGLGELRPDSQGWSLTGEAGKELANVAKRENLILLFHVTEPVGRDYAGKQGGALTDFAEFATTHQEIPIVGAHLAGGLPFYAPMPEVRETFDHLYVDTAAQRLLYDHTAYEHLIGLIGAERILLGSDYPLVPQSLQIEELRSGVFRSSDLDLILGANAQRLLGL